MKQNIIKNGIMAGVVAIGYVLLFYYINKEWLFTGTFVFSSLLFYLFFMYQAAKTVAKEDFKIVLRAAFGVFILANVIYYAFDYVLFNMIDKSLIDVQKESMIQYYASGAKSVEDQNQLSQSIEDAQFHDFKGIAFNFAKGAIGGFGLAIVISFLIKRKER